MQHKWQYKRKLYNDIGGIIERGLISVPVDRKMKTKVAETPDIIMPLLKPLVHPYLR